MVSSEPQSDMIRTLPIGHCQHGEALAHEQHAVADWEARRQHAGAAFILTLPVVVSWRSLPHPTIFSVTANVTRTLSWACFGTGTGLFLPPRPDTIVRRAFVFVVRRIDCDVEVFAMAQRNGSSSTAGVVSSATASSPMLRDRSHDADDADAEDLLAVRRQVAAAAQAREQALSNSIRLKVVELTTSDTSPVDVRKTLGRGRAEQAGHQAAAVNKNDRDGAASSGQATSGAEKDAAEDDTASASPCASGYSSASSGDIDSSDDPDKVAYNRPVYKAAGTAAASAPAPASPERPLLYFTTGDAVLRAGVRHAVRALGVYRVLDGARTQKMDRAVDRQRCEAPTVFVVGRRPRRSVRLLLSMAQGAWVVRDTWLLDSLRARCWKPYVEYVPSAFPGVLAARNSKMNGGLLFKGLRVGYIGDLSIAVDEFIQLVEAVGGCFANMCVEVLVRGTGGDDQLMGGAVAVVNQRWLPDSIARWECLPYGDYASPL